MAAVDCKADAKQILLSFH